MVMRCFLLMIVVVLVGCGKKDDGNTGVVDPNKPSPKAVPEKLITDPIVEKAIRKQLKKPSGELTEADLKKVEFLEFEGNQLTDVKGLEKLTQLKELNLDSNQLTDVKGLENLTQLEGLTLYGNKLTELPKGLEKLTQLEHLNLKGNPDLTKAQIDQLQKALPKCKILSNPKK